MKLTFYLFNESVTDFGAALLPAKLSGANPFEELTIVAQLPFEAKAYFQKERPTEPKWLSFLKDYCDIPVDITNRTNSFLLLLRASGRIFAVTMGFGFAAIDRTRVEKGFGLRVALNEVNPSKLKTVDARNIDTTTKQKRVLINRDSPLHDFDFDVDQDLLSLVSGQPKDASFARKLSGADSLVLTGDVAFPDLGRTCEALLRAFEKEDYKESFGFIDHLHVIKDKQTERQLEMLLADALAGRETANLMVAYPEMDNWTQIESFRLAYHHKKDFVEEVDLQEVYQFLDSHGFGNVDPHQMKITGFDQDGHPVTKAFSLYEYTVFETLLDGKRHLLSLNRWFELADDYVQEVDAEIRRIEEIADPGLLPPMQRGQREDEYNKGVAATRHDIICLDKQNFALKGQSRVEVCDLLSQRGEFICVKKYNGSSTLSHLFSQGVVSALLFNDSEEYRQFVSDKCQGSWPPPFGVDKLERQSCTFVFAVASDTQGKLVDSLPFFSKVNLRQARKTIERVGLKVKLYKIAYQ